MYKHIDVVCKTRIVAKFINVMFIVSVGKMLILLLTYELLMFVGNCVLFTLRVCAKTIRL